jgi:hypothetical protein
MSRKYMHSLSMGGMDIEILDDRILACSWFRSHPLDVFEGGNLPPCPFVTLGTSLSITVNDGTMVLVWP